MIERYTLPEMGGIWTEQAKFQSWLDVEIAACEAQAQLEGVSKGVVPGEATRGQEGTAHQSRFKGTLSERRHFALRTHPTVEQLRTFRSWEIPHFPNNDFHKKLAPHL
ncbi:MAG: hypothetical protein EBV59_12285 [Synechococcaceae bacterium WB7_1C_051]|nr:hypothetical protein [Synechococcaceae bacterium WB7_1C_051]